MNRTVSLWSIALTFAASSPTLAKPGTPPSTATAHRSAIKVVRNDRLLLAPATRICIETTLDPEAKRITEASGQVLYPGITQEITFNIAGRLADEFEKRGWSYRGPHDRIIAYIHHPSDPKSCFDRPDTIRVRLRIVQGASRTGYGVRLEAMQRLRAYVLSLERPRAVAIANEIRAALDYRTTHIPGTDRPYWDPTRDCRILADHFILDLLSPTSGPSEIEQLRGDLLAAAIRGRTIIPRSSPLTTPA